MITKSFRYLNGGILNPYFRLFWVWVFPYISRIHTAYIGEDSSILGTTSMFGDMTLSPIIMDGSGT